MTDLGALRARLLEARAAVLADLAIPPADGGAWPDPARLEHLAHVQAAIAAVDAREREQQAERARGEQRDRGGQLLGAGDG